MTKPSLRIFRYSQVYMRYNVDVLDHAGSSVGMVEAGKQVEVIDWNAPSYDLMSDAELHIVLTGFILKTEYISAYCDMMAKQTCKLIPSRMHLGQPIFKVALSNLLALGERRDDGYRPGLGGSISPMRG